ncbi:glycerophosphodiester phosphodiesterase family protein [Marinicella litoralis]|nr:glycerophosphodiester phosphodiesterase family protein [Marinicella litoralis]
MTSNAENKIQMIAHAGGGYDGHNYSNSIEALNGSYQGGFRYIEMDFSWTSDQQLVCLHDWDKTFKKIFKKKIKQAVSYAEFKQLVEEHPDFRSCTLDSLAQWLSNKPDVRIITDIKYDNLQGIRLIIEKYPELKSQLIPQFYQPEEYPILKDMGFKDLIWILYQYKGSKQSVIELSRPMELFAVSMRTSQAKNKTLQKLLKHHRIFVYTINDENSKIKLLENYGVTGLYTDFLAH